MNDRQDIMKKLWLVADMDSTLVERPATGLFPSLRESPCFEPIIKWLEYGGNLMVITTADDRTFYQVWDCIPRTLRRNKQVLLCVSEGAVLLYGNAEGDAVLEPRFRSEGAEGGTLMPEALAEQLCRQLREHVVIPLYQAMQSDRSLVPLLSGKYQKPIARVLDRLDAGDAIEDALSLEVLRAQGKIMQETNEVYMCCNRPSLPDQTKCFGAHPDPETSLGVSSISLMGVAHALHKRYSDALDMSKHGVSVSAAPNSLWLKKDGVDKGTPLRWLDADAEFEFSLSSSLAFGDSPHSNDAPLAAFQDQGMPFVSVSAKESTVPPDAAKHHVGGLEHGTAEVVRAILQRIDAWDGAEPFTLKQILPDAVTRARETLRSVRAGEQLDGREV